MEEICLWLPIALITCRSGISIRKKRLFRDYSQKAESTLSCFLKRVENTLIPPIEVACIAFTWGTSMMLRIYGMDLFILYPNERKTRRYLKLNDRDDSRIEVPYEEFIASSPIIWEERKPISDFVFDVEPQVYLFKDGSYIEENLHGAWQTEYQIRKMNNGCIRYSLIAILLIIMLLSRLYSHILSLLY